MYGWREREEGVLSWVAQVMTADVVSVSAAVGDDAVQQRARSGGDR